MRVVPSSMSRRWHSQSKTGDQRPVVRATVQKAQLRKFDYDTAWAFGGTFEHDRHRRGTFTTVIFGDASPPKEIRTIKSYTWTRSLDQDVATCQITMLNTEITPIGNVDEDNPSNDSFDQPGYATYNRGEQRISQNRWGYDTETGWTDMYVPDRLVRTYEGYSQDPSKVPAEDPNLVQSGTWLIDRVTYNAEGDITLEMRDVGRLLLNQIVFPPVVPHEEYPLSWSAVRDEQVDTRDAKGGSWSERRIRGTASSSNERYIGKGLTNPPFKHYVSDSGGFQGHHPRHVLENDPMLDEVGGTQNKWMSTGQESKNSKVWWEVELDEPVNLAAIKIHPSAGPYRIYISLRGPDGWYGNKEIPYEVTTEGVNINADIPFVASTIADRWMPFDVVLKRKYPDVRRIRLTFSHLHDVGMGKYNWFAGLKDIRLYTAPNLGDLSFEKGTKMKVVGNYWDYCADEATEILTRRGWLRHDEVAEGDEALAIDPETGMSSWQVVESVFRRHRQREMVLREGSVHSSLTTPDHRWLVRDHKDRWTWRTSETLKHGHAIPLAAPRADHPGQAKYVDALVELVAWFWTEGWTEYQGGCVNVRLAQSRAVHAENCDRIESALVALAGPAGQKRGREGSWSMQQRADGVVTYCLGQDLTKELLAVAPNKVPTSEFLTSLTRAQLDLFIETSIDADGWRKPDGGRFLAQADEERSKSFEMACALAGIGTSVQKNGGMWTISLLRHKQFRPALCREERVDYDGIIWCPTLKHHNWLARRHGKVYFTGNTDIVKWVCAWGGWFWPPHNTGMDFVQKFGVEEEHRQYVSYAEADNVLPRGRVWGDFMRSGTHGKEDLTVDLFDKKPLMDVINYVRDILGFVFFVDELGGIIWRMPNIWELGNYQSPARLGQYVRRRTSEIITIDEEETLIQYDTTLNSEQLRERIFVANSLGKVGTVIKGPVPYYTGFRRVAGWTDQHFKTKQETRVMADMIAARQMFEYRRSRVTIPGYPAIQIDDQIRILERVTNETYYHYVLGITCNLDMESGDWTYQLDTHWLGERPADAWVVKVNQLDKVTEAYLANLKDPDKI